MAAHSLAALGGPVAKTLPAISVVVRAGQRGAQPRTALPLPTREYGSIANIGTLRAGMVNQ